MISLSVVDGIGKPKDMSLEMIASKQPRLMYPATKVRVMGLDATAQYEMTLQLQRRPYRLMLRGTRWTQCDEDPTAEQDEVDNRVASDRPSGSAGGRQTGAFFMEKGVNFEKARISFNRQITHERKDTLFVRKYFEYHQFLCIDQVIPCEPTLHRVGSFKLEGTEFIATSHFESTRMCQFYAIAFENLRTLQWEDDPKKKQKPPRPVQKLKKPRILARPRMLLKPDEYSKLFKAPRVRNVPQSTVNLDASQ